MKQEKKDNKQIINVEYSGAASLLLPTLYKQDEMFYCLLGPNNSEGVFGSGTTPERAIKNWDDNLKKHLATAGPDNEIVQYVTIILSESNKVTEQVIESTGMESHIASIKDPATKQQVRDFYDQFKPRKR